MSIRQRLPGGELETCRINSEMLCPVGRHFPALQNKSEQGSRLGPSGVCIYAALDTSPWSGVRTLSVSR